MTQPESIDLPAGQASVLLQRQLLEASSAFDANDLGSALDILIPASGTALQLGPPATQRLLAQVVGQAQVPARCGHAHAQCVPGPTLVV